MSLKTFTVPLIWKTAFISPIHKKGSKSEVTNYRPVSKLCILAKVFERLVYNQLYAALKNSFSLSQHGFLRGRSTTSNLLELDEYISVEGSRWMSFTRITANVLIKLITTS